MNIKQALVNMLVHSQCLMEAMDLLDQQKNFKTRDELKFFANGFKAEAENLVTEFWGKIPDSDKHFFTDIVNDKIRLLEAYDKGELIIER